MRIDVEANRSAAKWTRKEQVGRVLWDLLHPLFAYSPRPLWEWRNGLLRLLGARVGRNVRIHPTVLVTIPWNVSIDDGGAVGDRAILYALGPIDIASNTTISQGAHICGGTHDHRDPAFPLVKAPIRIGANVWVCADAFVGPGVEVGERSIVGARAVVMRSVSAHSIVAGNPARPIKMNPE